MVHKALVMASLLLAGLAGCLSDENEPFGAAQVVAGREFVESDGLLRLQGAPETNATEPAWFLAEAEASPEFSLTSFRWTVPEGTIVTPEGYDQEFVVLEVGVMPTNGSLRKLMVFAFDTDGREAELIGTTVQVPMEVTWEGLTGFETQAYVPAFTPFKFHLRAGDLDAGDEITLVFAAEGDRSPMPVVWQAFDAYPEDYIPAEEAGDLLDDLLGEGPGQAVPLVVTGSGAAANLYVEYNNMLVPPARVVFRAGDVEVHQESRVLPGMEAVRSGQYITLETAFPSEEGWTLAYGHASVQPGEMDWDFQADLHGTFIEKGGQGAALLVQQLGSMPRFMGHVSGPGSSTIDMDLFVNAAAGSDDVALQHISLGATVETLTGRAWSNVAYDGEECTGCALVHMPGLATLHPEGASSILPLR